METVLFFGDNPEPATNKWKKRGRFPFFRKHIELVARGKVLACCGDLHPAAAGNSFLMRRIPEGR